jgi:hypothetical protein
MDALSIATFFGGIVGSALRAAISPDQSFASRKTVADIVIGGLVGILVPVTVGLPEAWTLEQKFAAIAVLAYTASNVLQDVAGQVARRK